MAQAREVPRRGPMSSAAFAGASLFISLLLNPRCDEERQKNPKGKWTRNKIGRSDKRKEKGGRRERNEERERRERREKKEKRR